MAKLVKFGIGVERYGSRVELSHGTFVCGA